MGLIDSVVNYFTGGNNKSNKSSDRKMKTTYMSASNKEYNIYKENKSGRYYINSGGKKYYFENPNAIKLIDQNKAWCISKQTYEKTNNTKSTSKTSSTKTSSSSGGGGGGGYGGYSGGYSSGSSDDYEKLIKEYRKLIDKLQKPKVWTAKELAKKFNISDKYNMQYWLKTYNDATNKYYKDAIAEQEKINQDAELSNSLYAGTLLKNYLNGYLNAAPTAVGRGTIAANALNSMLGADKANEEAATNLASIIESYREKWNAEKEQNKVLARERYNDIGKWLLERGVNVNTAEVQNYINTMNAYDTAYSGIRNAQNNLASTAAAAYQNNVNAALAANSASASSSSDDFLRRAYQMYYSGERDPWQQAYNNVNKDVSNCYTSNSSSN